jgi:hypothetical protein
LNSLQTEKSSLLLKIQELEEKLLETQLQLERVTDEKLTRMLSIQKSPTDKTGLGYVAPSSDAPSTSKTVFVKPVVPKPPPTVEDKGKDKVNNDVPGAQKPHSIRRPPICHHCGLSGHVRPQCSLLKAHKAKAKKEVPQQVNGTRSAASIRLHGILTKHHGDKHRGINIKPLGLMLLGFRHLSISSLSNDLYQLMSAKKFIFGPFNLL